MGCGSSAARANTLGVMTRDDKAKVSAALKEALRVSVNDAVKKASAPGGFANNPDIAIPWPEELRDLEATFRKVPGGQVDNFIRSINDAAEHAAIRAGPVFNDKIDALTIDDGIQLLDGKDDACTRYLKKASKKETKDAFRPIIEETLAAASVVTVWKALMDGYNLLCKIPGSKLQPITFDLTDYAIDKTYEGMITLVGQYENQIRNNPLAGYNSQLIKDVFSESKSWAQKATNQLA